MVRLDINYERAVETIQFYGYIDCLVKMGGLKSILTPLLSIFTPLFVLVFLLKLTTILKQSYKNEYYYELKQTIFTNMEALNADDDFYDYLEAKKKFPSYAKLQEQVEELVDKPEPEGFDQIDLYSLEIKKLEEMASKVL